MTKRITGTLLTLLLATSTVLRADDTEIYFETVGGLGADPMVFFYIEYTPNLASTICTGVTSANIDTACPAIASVKTYMAANDLADGKVDLFEMTRAALKRVLIGLGNLKVGLLMAHDNLASCTGGPTATNCSQGGYIPQGLTLIQAPSAGFNPKTATPAQLATELNLKPGKKTLFTKLDALLSPQGGFSHENQNKEIYFELFRHLTGQAVYNGFNGKVDYGTSNTYSLGDLVSLAPAGAVSTYNCAVGYTCDATTTANGTARFVATDNKTKGMWNGDFAADGTGTFMSTKPFMRDTTIIDGSNYRSPFTKDCAKVFVINVVDGGGNSANDADTAIKAGLTSGGMGFNVSNSDTGFVEMVRWLHDKDLADGTINKDLKFLDTQNVTSFFIAKQPQQVDAAAKAGGTGYAIPLTEDAQSVVDKINDVFTQILSVSTTFVSASIPVNVFNRSEVIDNAYIALFQADGKAQPRWVGNIKKLKLRVLSNCTATDPVTGQCVQSKSTIGMVDALGVPAISPVDGRILASALTFWTEPKGYDLYDNIDPESEIAGRDGRSVHRGGAGQRIPGFLSGWANWDGTNYVNFTTSAPGSTGHIEAGYPDYRNLYTDTYLWNTKGDITRLWSLSWDEMWPALFIPGDAYNQSQWSIALDYLLLTGDYNNDMWGTGTGLGTFWGLTMLYGKQTSNPYCVAMGYATGVCPEWPMYMEMIALYYHMYGYDFWGEKPGFSLANWWEMFNSRRWLLGDPLHSRPLPINYGARTSAGYSKTNPDIRILAGGNDGFMRMIRNTKPSCTPDAIDPNKCESGEEVWAFIPQSVMRIQKQLMDNAAGGNPVHPYGVDGAPTAYIKDKDGTIDPAQGDEVLLFFGMRRGGRLYYGLDITDPETPAMLWKIDTKTPGYGELGYTFSQPVVRQLDWGSGRTPVLIVGGGYDMNKDIPNLGTNDTIGRAIYIINAKTGELVWKAVGSGISNTTTYVNKEMLDSIPSEVSVVDSNGDGLADRAYVGDTGGRVWRVDMPGNDRSQWKVTMLLDLGRHVTTDLANDRRFFHAVDVVPAQDAWGPFDAVVIGSGNRAHPLQTHTSDYIYMYKDRAVYGPLPDGFTAATEADLGDVTDNCLTGGGAGGSTVDLNRGWKLRLMQSGEKILSSALTVNGSVFFSSYIPATSKSDLASCGPSEGSGLFYTLSLQTAAAVVDYDTSNAGNECYRKLLSAGIASDPVPLKLGSNPICVGTGCTGDGGGSGSGSGGGGGGGSGGGSPPLCILPGDMQCEPPPGSTSWSSYWYEKQK